MTSTVASTTRRHVSKASHIITKNSSSELQYIPFTRTVANGKSSSHSLQVLSYWTESCDNWPIPVQKCESYMDYMAGCKAHGSNCLGNYAVTPRGTVLMPSTLAKSLGVMVNDYARGAEGVFAREGAVSNNRSSNQERQYREKITSLMLTKTGKMRGDMASSIVDGSAREVITQFWNKMTVENLNIEQSGIDMLKERKVDASFFCIPDMVAANMRVLRVKKDKDLDMMMGYYEEDEVREGDWAIVVRAPSLGPRSVQPMMIVLWQHECFGLDPSFCDQYHADFDGDEMHIYILGRSESIEECMQWVRQERDIYEKVVEEKFIPKSWRENGTEDVRSKFMVGSTLSIRELMDGIEMPDISPESRMKEAMTNMSVDRLKNPMRVMSEFISESLRGIEDVKRQQLSQGFIGRITREAKVSAACLVYRGNGVFYMMRDKECIKIVDTAISDISFDRIYPLGGNPAIRGISKLCGKFQQAMLDAHRVSTQIVTQMNLIENFLNGGTDSITLVAMRGTRLPKNSWNCFKDGITFCIIHPTAVKSLATNVVAAYHPSVLADVQKMNGDTRLVALGGVQMICNAYGVRLTKLELHSVAELTRYKCETASEPITTKKGIHQRRLRWFQVLFANHYKYIGTLHSQGFSTRPVKPQTITDAFAFCTNERV